MKKPRSLKYEDMIDLPRPVCATRARMPLGSRAAQFAPFAALTGFEAAVAETARLTDERVEPDDCAKELLNERLNIIMDRQNERPRVCITYFVPDPRKPGGSYASLTGRVRRIDEYGRAVVMEDKTKIAIDEIISIDGDLFSG
jgi:hypothetical protein